MPPPSPLSHDTTATACEHRSPQQHTRKVQKMSTSSSNLQHDKKACHKPEAVLRLWKPAPALKLYSPNSSVRKLRHRGIKPKSHAKNKSLNSPGSLLTDTVWFQGHLFSRISIVSQYSRTGPKTPQPFTDPNCHLNILLPSNLFSNSQKSVTSENACLIPDLLACSAPYWQLQAT